VGYTSHAAAVAAAAAGDGVVLTLAHTVIEELRRRALTRIDVRGTPMLEMWHASTLGFGRVALGWGRRMIRARSSAPRGFCDS
jgi:hypothetical protein